jgi:hypothetical protein
MRTIPVPNRNPVGNVGPAGVASQPLTSNVRMDEGALNAPNRAMAQLGGTIAGAGDMMGKFAMEKAEQRNKGILANEETVRMETAAKIQAFMEANPNDPDSWGQVSNTTWDAYEKGRSERSKKDKWAPVVTEKDTLQYQLYRADFGIRARAEQDKAYVRQSNARLEANAEAKLRSGDYDGFVKSMDSMNLFADVKERKIRQGIEEGMYRVANGQLDALRDLPPSQAIPAIEAFVAAVNAKDEKTGKFKEYEFERGGMSIGARQQLVTVAQGRIREQERTMAVNGRAIVADIRMGRATVQNVMDAVKAGDLTADVAKAIMPEVAQAGQLKEELIQASRAEVQMEKGDYALISEKLRGGFSAKMFGRQPSDKEYQRIQADIAGAKHLTKETRLKLMDEFFTLKLADISDLQEEGPDNGRWADRDITPPERSLRRDVLGEYKKLLPALGDVTAGDLMFSQEARIRSFFDSAKTPRTQAEIEKFAKEQLLPEIQKAAGFEALKDAFKF